MNVEPFLKPRLTGPRFEGGAVPLHVLADFAVLEQMIVDIAKAPSGNGLVRGLL